jgi:hypothetical protein
MPPMLTGADFQLHMGIKDRQIQCEAVCKTAVQRLRTEHPDELYTREMCSEVIQAGHAYDRLNTAAALAERHLSAEGIEYYLEEEEVSSIILLICR